MLTLDTIDEITLQLNTELPAGKTQGELITQCRQEIRQIAPQLYGKHIRIYGRVTTGMALCLGHELAHICKSVSIFDPKENQFFVAIEH
ncbi:hypothetical protein WDW89_16905 [Deltaproteobacteria bacterium TL4]